jgi:hypothetical protein
LQCECAHNEVCTNPTKHFTLTFRAMGQQKRFFESENIEQQQGRGQARSGQSKNKHFGFMPGMFVSDRPENLPLGELLKLILLRLKRIWVSFRFQADKKTHGALRPKAAFLDYSARRGCLLCFCSRRRTSRTAFNFGGQTGPLSGRSTRVPGSWP